MLVSHKKQFIYTKTVKTAGTTIESFFEPYCMHEGEWVEKHGREMYVSDAGIIGARTSNLLEIQACIWWNHMPAKTIKKLLGNEIWKGYFKFCVVRNPYEKMVSAFNSLSTIQDVKRNGFSDSNELKNYFENWLYSIPHPLDRNKYVVDGEPCMDYVIKFETLIDDVREACEQLNIEFRKNRLNHLKKSNKPSIPLREYYSGKSIKLIKDYYDLELELFDYSVPW